MLTYIIMQEIEIKDTKNRPADVSSSLTNLAHSYLEKKLSGRFFKP